MNLIGIVGKKRSGKDTFASVLTGRGWKRAAFADVLKAEVADWLGISVEDLEDRKEAFRAALQERGAKMRGGDQGYWIKRLVISIAAAFNHGERIVVTDVRYQNEAAWICANGGVLVRLVRSGAADDDDHASERELDGIETHRTYTCSSPEEVKQRAREFIEDA
jgi:hypothetical protein